MRRALGKIRSWRTPPNWSPRDWLDEARAITAAAGWLAEFDYDAARGVPRTAYIYRRAVTSVWTRYRQEWAYGLRFAAEVAIAKEETASPPATDISDAGADRRLGQALDQLSFSDQWLIRELFWNQARQDHLAATLRVSQQAISRRKRRVLRRLREALNGSRHSLLVSPFLAAYTLLTDALDLIPVADCWL